PGNVRELLLEVRTAVQNAQENEKTLLEAKHLDENAGVRMDAAGPEPQGPADFPATERIEEALRKEKGNVTRAAKTLGLHRNQLRRWLARTQVDPRNYGGPAQSLDDE